MIVNFSKLIESKLFLGFVQYLIGTLYAMTNIVLRKISLRFCARILTAISLFNHSIGYAQTASRQLNVTPQECEWIEKYVKDSSRGGMFHLSPKQVYLSISSSPETRLEHAYHQKEFVEKTLKELDLPVSISSEINTSQVFMYFFKAATSSDEAPKLLSEFRNVDWLRASFPNAPYFETFVFNTCWIIPETRRNITRIKLLIPFDRGTGVPIEDARRCATEGLIKAFGINLGRDNWTVGCERCVDIDRRVARLLSENNKSTQEQISTEDILQRLTGPVCKRNKGG